MEIVAKISIFICLFSIQMLIRNNVVYRYKMMWIDMATAAGHWDIAKGNYDNATSYLKILDEVSYQEMAWKFWRHPRSFMNEDRLKPWEVEDGNKHV